MKRGLIITGGTMDLKLLKEVYHQYHYDSIIAVDGGLASVAKLSLKIDDIVGDMDTVDSEILNWYEGKVKSGEAAITIHHLNPMKDMSDTQEALEIMMKRGVEEIYLVGATGTRLDHVLANIHLLYRALINNVKVYILDKNNRIQVINQGIEIEKEVAYGTYVSLMPFTNEVTKITLEGMKYPLQDYTLVQGDSLCISNEIVEEKARIHFESGILIVMETRD